MYCSCNLAKASYWLVGEWWEGVKNRYLGLKFYVKGKAHYGWARMTVDIDPETSPR